MRLPFGVSATTPFLTANDGSNSPSESCLPPCPYVDARDGNDEMAFASKVMLEFTNYARKVKPDSLRKIRHS